MMIPRVFEQWVRELLGRFPVVAVVGSRQVGKSTLVQQPSIGSNRKYVTLDDFATLSLATKDPAGLVAEEGPLTIDEVQRSPDLLVAIKREVDRDRKAGRYLLTGSADLNLTAHLSRALAGRAFVAHLPPISWREQAGHLARPAWTQWLEAESIGDVERSLKGLGSERFDMRHLLVGGYPLAVTADARGRSLWFESFRHTYLERDVRQVANIAHLAEFARLMEMVADRSAQIMNQASLARELGMSLATLSRYLSMLEATFQIVRLPPWFSNIGKRLVKSPKIYWRDTGLAAHLMGLASVEHCRSANRLGPLLEAFVMMEILSLLNVYRPSARLHYLRTHTGLEVDGVMTEGQRILPFEVKASATLREDDAHALERFMEWDRKARIGLVFYAGDRAVRLSAKILALPLDSLLC